MNFFPWRKEIPVRQTIDEAVAALEEKYGAKAGRVDLTRDGFARLRAECAEVPELNLIFIDSDGEYFYRGLHVFVHEAIH